MGDGVTDTWLVGVVSHDEALSGLRVHAGYVASGPSSGRDHRLGIRLRFGDPAAPHFPSDSESAALLVREEAAVALLSTDAVLVGVLTVPGFRELIFHTADPQECLAIFASPDADAVGADACDVVTDPAWSTYRGLFTDAVPADADRRRIHEVAERTGASTPECRVEHRFSFPTLADADQAAAALRDAGVEVTFEAPDDLGAAAPPRFVIVETEQLTQADMARSRDALSGFALSWSGDYLGWAILER